MYERSYGYRYSEAGDHATCSEIAKLIRRDIKQAQQEGLLPTRWTYSVRSDSLSVDVEVRDCLDAWQECDGMNCGNVWCAARNDPQYAHAATPHQLLTAEAEATKMTLERIHNAYNHDGSEIQVDFFDVRYYGIVRFEDAQDSAFRKREAERLASKRAARDAGEIVGKIANYGRDGRPTIHLVIRTPEEREVLACGARMSRYGFRQRVRDDAAVTCSRCAKRVH